MFSTAGRILFNTATSETMLILHRTAGTNELAAWISALPQLGRQGVVLGIVNASEFRMGLFEAYYEMLLHRTPDPLGLASWVNSGLDVSAVRVAFESGSEFFNNG